MWSPILGLAAILTLAVMMAPVANRIKIPYTVLLAIVGVVLGFVAQHVAISPDVAAPGAPDSAPHGDDGGHSADHDGGHNAGSFLSQLVSAVAGLRITSDLILFLFLPALVFESALSLDLRKLLADIRSILFLAVIGVGVSTAIVGISLANFAGVTLTVGLLLGAIVSATDPVAVIALFKDLNAPKRLTVLVEGESLFNDATAIVLSSILLGLLTLDSNVNAFSGLTQFLIVFVGGIIVGIVIARPAAWLMGAFKRSTASILTLTVTLPFIAFVIAEHFLHVSGVMAVVACGLTVGSVGRRLIPPQVFEEVEHAWHHLSFWATSLIFILVGLAVPRMLGDNPLSYWDDILVLIIVTTVARGVVIYGMLPMLSAARLGQAVSRAYQTIMFWGGLRGAVSLALALIVLEADMVAPEARSFIAVLVTSYVMFTLVFQATTINAFMRVFGLDKLSPTDQSLRDRSLASAMMSVGEDLDRFASFHEVNDQQRAEIVTKYKTAVAEARATALDQEALTTEEWAQIGLSMALAQERQLYLKRFGDGLTTNATLRYALSRLDDVSDAMKADGAIWENAARKTVAFRNSFRYALTAQQRLGLTGPLAKSLSRRLGVLTFVRQVLREQRKEGVTDIEALLPEEARETFHQKIEHRYRLVAQNDDALALQYPDYAAALHKRDLSLTGFRLEERAYDRLLEQSIIGPEIHRDLLNRLDGAGADAHNIPPLRLRLDPQSLIAKVPFFADLEQRQRKKLARHLKTRFAVPEEVLINQGDVGEDMFFIASGAVRVILPDQDITLGTGDFFGELALITDQPRNATIEALGFCTLLALHKRDFMAFLKRDKNVRDRIHRIAKERLGADVSL